MTTRAPTASTAASPAASPDEFLYYCAKCGSPLAKGKLPQLRATGVCGGCARIVTLVSGEPFADTADLSKVPLRDRAGLEQRAQEIRRARGIREPILI
jgi:hypothetical protein